MKMSPSLPGRVAGPKALHYISGRTGTTWDDSSSRALTEKRVPECVSAVFRRPLCSAPTSWEADALPTELHPRNSLKCNGLRTASPLRCTTFQWSILHYIFRFGDARSGFLRAPEPPRGRHTAPKADAPHVDRGARLCKGLDAARSHDPMNLNPLRTRKLRWQRAAGLNSYPEDSAVEQSRVV